MPEVEAMDDLVYHYLESSTASAQRVHVVGGSLGGWLAPSSPSTRPSGSAWPCWAAGCGPGQHGHGHLPDDTRPGGDDALPRPGGRRRHVRRPAWTSSSPPTATCRPGALRLGPYLNNPSSSGAASITAPTLVLWADDDRVIPIEHGRLYAERIPDATLQIVEDCGHAMYFEQTEAFADAVTEFLLSGSESAT
jgi:pimeloyl-ACP methyl ester carboxylesterase